MQSEALSGICFHFHIMVLHRDIYDDRVIAGDVFHRLQGLNFAIMHRSANNISSSILKQSQRKVLEVKLIKSLSKYYSRLIVVSNYYIKNSSYIFNQIVEAYPI